MGNLLLDFLFPARCFGCGKLGNYICAACHKTLKVRTPQCPECDRSALDGVTHPRCKRPQGLDGLVTVFHYEGVIKQAVKSLKYRFVYDAAQTLVTTIPHTLLNQLNLYINEAVVYPIPLHTDRLRWRGFNQAEKLGVFLAKRLDVPMISDLLIRVYKRKPQADITDRKTRLQNAQGLFALEHKKNLPDNIILFDDVWTTGATMKEAAKILKRGGVEKIWGVALAR